MTLGRSEPYPPWSRTEMEGPNNIPNLIDFVRFMNFIPDYELPSTITDSYSRLNFRSLVLFVVSVRSFVFFCRLLMLTLGVFILYSLLGLRCCILVLRWFFLSAPSLFLRTFNCKNIVFTFLSYLLGPLCRVLLENI